MKLVSWNVNGLRACVKKGFLDYFQEVDADIFCVQETKLQEGQITLELEGYHQYWNYAIKKGYSGTAVFTKNKPLSVRYGLGTDESEDEGRILTLEFEDFFLGQCLYPKFTKRFSENYVPFGLGGSYPPAFERFR
jgi:exodeoxyribonuclease-3